MPRPLRIVLVNDDEDGLFLFEHTVRKDYPTADTQIFRSAEAALLYVSRAPVDAIVTDSRMPGLSGIDLTRRVRAFDAHIPIIMVTGAEEKKAEALAAGVSCFISDIDRERIRAEIRRTIDAARWI